MYIESLKKTCNLSSGEVEVKAEWNTGKPQVLFRYQVLWKAPVLILWHFGTLN